MTLKMTFQDLCDSAKSRIHEISTDEAEKKLNADPSIVVIDVREQDELPKMQAFPHIRIPVSQLEKKLPELSGKRVVLFCKSGARSSRAAKMLREQGINASHVILGLTDY